MYIFIQNIYLFKQFLLDLQTHGDHIRRRLGNHLTEVHPVLENQRLFHNQRRRPARRVPARAVGRLPALGPVPPVVVIVAVTARNVEEAVVLQMTPLALRESRRFSTLSDREANRTPARENPVL